MEAEAGTLKPAASSSSAVYLAGVRSVGQMSPARDLRGTQVSPHGRPDKPRVDGVDAGANDVGWRAEVGDLAMQILARLIVAVVMASSAVAGPFEDTADAAYQRGLAAGGTSIEAPNDAPYGDRRAGVKDPCGNQWYVAHRR